MREIVRTNLTHDDILIDNTLTIQVSDCIVTVGPDLGCLTYFPDSAVSANQTRAEPDTGRGGGSPQPSARGH